MGAQDSVLEPSYVDISTQMSINNKTQQIVKQGLHFTTNLFKHTFILICIYDISPYLTVRTSFFPPTLMQVLLIPNSYINIR